MNGTNIVFPYVLLSFPPFMFSKPYVIQYCFCFFVFQFLIFPQSDPRSSGDDYYYAREDYYYIKEDTYYAREDYYYAREDYYTRENY